MLKLLRPNPLSPNAFADHCRLVDAVTSAGVPPPDAWTQLRQRFTVFRGLGNATPICDRLAAAIVDGAPDADIPGLRAAALAEQQIDQGKILGAVHAAVAVRLREVYAEAAIQNYAQVVELFDAQAAKFVAATQQVDVETPAVGMVDQPDKARRAWLDGERDGHRLTTLIPALAAAAQLTGRVPESAGRDNGGKDAVVLPLVCDPADLHRRRVSEAWDSLGRCGRWSALVALGARIRGWPADALDSFEPYRSAKPMRQQFRPLSGPLYSAEMVWVDPEDPRPQEAEPAKAKRARRGRLAP